MGIQNSKTMVALVDDHILLRNGLASHIRSLDGYDVLFEADNGIDFQKNQCRSTSGYRAYGHQYAGNGWI